jgi:hypothetical protein
MCIQLSKFINHTLAIHDQAFNVLPVSETLGTDQVARGRCQVDLIFLIFVLTTLVFC